MSEHFWGMKHAVKERGRRLAARWDRLRFPRAFDGVLSDGEAGRWISAALQARRPVLVGRLGSVEARLMGEARWRPGCFSRVTLREAHRNAGMFPLDAGSLERAAERMQAALGAVDLLAAWDSPHQARLVADLVPLPQRCSLAALEPWWLKAPWTATLAGRRVLVVHPFAISMERQLAHRRELFADSQVLPEFELLTLRPPLTLGGARDGYSSWGAALDDLVDRTSALEFDVALLGCGAYGLPLAAAIKAMGRPVVHLGGALQLLFGIRGRRWETMPRFAALMNSSWVRPSPEETPIGAAQVDGGCYW
ncbi:MAG: hypothetical protein WCK64_02860 [Synechococcaceae cyanobacterium ELA445]